MKRKLLVIRHANTEPVGPGQTDHARELTPKGRGDALRVAAKLEAIGWTPAQIVNSDAARAEQTAKLMSEVFEAHVDTTSDPELYLAGVDEACEALYALPDDVAEAALVGHNPGWQSLVRWLSGTSLRMSPGTTVLLVGSGETWAEAAQQNRWHIEQVIRPETL